MQALYTLCGKHFLTMLSLQPDRSGFWVALHGLGVLERQTLALSRPLHRAGEGFFSQSPLDSAYAQLGDRHNQARVLSLEQ